MLFGPYLLINNPKPGSNYYQVLPGFKFYGLNSVGCEVWVHDNEDYFDEVDSADCLHLEAMNHIAKKGYGVLALAGERPEVKSALASCRSNRWTAELRYGAINEDELKPRPAEG